MRKIYIGKLLDAKVPEVFVAHQNGHKSIGSLKSYKSARSDQRYEMSSIYAPTNTNLNINKCIQQLQYPSPQSFMYGANFTNCTVTFAAVSVDNVEPLKKEVKESALLCFAITLEFTIP